MARGTVPRILLDMSRELLQGFVVLRFREDDVDRPDEVLRRLAVYVTR